MKQIITLLVAAGMTLAAFAQTPSTVGVSMNPTSYVVRGSSTNFHTANSDRGVATVATVAQLATITNARHGAVVDVRGYDADQDLPYPLRFTLNTNSVATTNRFVVANAGGTGRWEHEWNNDVREFGAVPYHPKYTAVPWGYLYTNQAIGTGPFSVWVRTTFPTTYTQAYGMFEFGRAPSTNVTSASIDLCSALGMRATPDVWGFVFRGTNAGSTVGTIETDAAALDATPAAVAAWAGQTVDIVLTRSGTNVALYFNGTNVTANFTNSNPAGWGKALALNEQVFIQVGNNGNIWYWPKAIQRFALWSTALTSGQAADPSGTAGKALDFTPETTEEPQDNTEAFNRAAAYVDWKGGGQVYFGPGGWRIDGEILGGMQTAWRGGGASPYPSAFRRGFIPGTSFLIPWFGATNRVFLFDQTQGEGPLLLTRPLSNLGSGNVSSRWGRSSLRDFVIYGGLSKSSDGIWIDRYGSISVENIGFYYVPNHPVLAYVVNSLLVDGCEGPMGLGAVVKGSSDVSFSRNFLDGAKGPVLTWGANLSRIHGNVFEIGNNPRSAVPPYEMEASANASTDTITVSSGYGHRLRRGHIVRFVTDTGTLPSGLVADTDYYAIPTGDQTLKVSLVYVDEIGLTGSFYASSVVDITDAGSGTWYMGRGPAVGMLIQGDSNTIVGNQGQQNYDGGVIFEGSAASRNAVGNNVWILNGPGNASTNVAAIRVKGGASYNTFTGNQGGDRGLTGYSALGFAADSSSLYSALVGNLFDVDRPYEGDGIPSSVIVDADGIMGSWSGTKGNLYVPSSAGFTRWDPRDMAASAAVTYDRTAKRLYVASDVANADASWNYAPTFPFVGPAYWSGSSSTLSMANNGTGQSAISLNSTYSSAMVYAQVNSTNSNAEGFRLFAGRNWGPSTSSFAPLPSGAQLFELIGGGTATNTSTMSIGGSIGIRTSDAWGANDTPGEVFFTVVPNGESSRIDAAYFNARAAASRATNETMMVLSRWTGAAWTSERVYVTNLSGVNVLYLP